VTLSINLIVFTFHSVGAYMNSLDESDLQFYATYVQPVVIAEDLVQAGLVKSSLTIIPAEIPHRTLQLPFIIVPIAIPVNLRLGHPGYPTPLRSSIILYLMG